MKIHVRNVGSGNYCEVTVDHNDTTIVVGWLDAEERRALADTLREAAGELCPEAERVDPFEVALDALHEYQSNWDSGLPAEYAQGERIAMECAVEAVRDALNEAREA
ncbi:OTU domain-containing protein [Burkholderia cenocepacia]|uniref:hypothetical protein n=1 Tax=Burkholderia cenocepacia TaxID=95486 RepID=UPI001909039F|nr:hypothetical protein [Burkholderia cenocepacia]MBJ9895257.1 hypothetical protein [Burkholderia cenocepacia]MBJ9917639.1 hypothetical protein [Burkholderia cenocepacia]